MRWRGLLIHLTHYDPMWYKRKKTEQRFDRRTAEACIDAAARSGMNLLIIDIEDAVIYKHFPGNRKPYSVPMSELKELADRARGLGLEVVPKLNFSKSPQHRHSHWLWPEQCPPDSAQRWREAFLAIDEVIAATKPRYLHVGMDEDDTRSPDEYRKALFTLYRALRKRKVRMMMWADCGHRWRPAERWKVLPAIHELPRDVILMPWDYAHALADWTRQFTRWGFDVIGACSYSESKPNRAGNAREWADVVKKHKAAGVLLTKWIRCSRANRPLLLEAIRRCGKVFARVDCSGMAESLSAESLGFGETNAGRV